MKQQVFNPYLPAYEYVPDAEPHLFNGRVYVYGSHDRAFGTTYCEGNYVVWSAPENDLSDWRFEGEVYTRTQDPSNAGGDLTLWAPDVTKGPDGRYYLYYCLSFYPEIGVAVSDSPAGPFEFYGHVKYPEHINKGAVLREFMPFDPAVLTDDDGRVYLYYGFAPACEKEMKIPDVSEMDLSGPEMEKFRQQMEYLKTVQFGENGMAVELEADMLTVKSVPTACIPGGHHTAGTGFEGHGFFEASSIRKIGGKYYFVYSSHKSHELCYAISDRPMEGYVYGGTIVSTGDIGLDGRTEPVNILGNTHGGMVQANGQWYIFYHRQTNGTEYSRQGCAEKITIEADGSIRQVPVTSCGLNDGPLKAQGSYSAAIACHITDPSTVKTIDYNNPIMQRQTRITAAADGKSQFVTDVGNGSVVGFKYFELKGSESVSIKLCGSFKGTVSVSFTPEKADAVSFAEIQPEMQESPVLSLGGAKGVKPLYFIFEGEGKLDFTELAFCGIR